MRWSAVTGNTGKPAGARTLGLLSSGIGWLWGASHTFAHAGTAAASTATCAWALALACSTLVLVCFIVMRLQSSSNQCVVRI